MFDNKKRLLSIIGCVLVLAVVLWFASPLIRRIGFGKSGDKREIPLGESIAEDAGEFEEHLKGEESDIEGMSKYDKYAMGLIPDDGADSDADGLTDKEEIEVYHTNPLLVSTSGDLYSDKYKVDNGMELTKKYEYQNDLSFNYNICEEVLLTPKDASDFYANVRDITGIGLFDLGDKEVYKAYLITFYNGEVAIDLSKIDNIPEGEELSVYIMDSQTGDAKECNSSVNGSILSIDKGLEFYDTTIIFITKKDENIIDKVKGVFGGTSNAELTVGGKTRNSIKAVIVYKFLYLKNVVYYAATGNAEQDEAIEQYLGEIYKNVVGKTPGSDGIQGGKIVKLTADEVGAKIKALNSYLGIGLPKWMVSGEEYDSGDKEDSGFICHFTSFDGYLEYGEYHPAGNSEEDEKTEGFTHRDHLPFYNFADKYGAKGLCAGFAAVTEEVYNTGTIAMTSGTFKDEETGKKVKWDITPYKYKEEQTFFNAGLDDYKYFDFPYNHFKKMGLTNGDQVEITNVLGKNLSEGEEEFLKMLHAYWRKHNDIPRSKYLKGWVATYDPETKKNYPAWYFGKNGKDILNSYERTIYFYDPDILKPLIYRLDKGKICTLSLTLFNKEPKNPEDEYMLYGCHAVNIVGYKKGEYQTIVPHKSGEGDDDYYLEKSMGDYYIFDIYDSNYPEKIFKLFCYVTVVNNHRYLSYYYKTFGDCPYYATSGLFYNEFIIYDNFKIINDFVKAN